MNKKMDKIRRLLSEVKTEAQKQMVEELLKLEKDLTILEEEVEATLCTIESLIPDQGST